MVLGQGVLVFCVVDGRWEGSGPGVQGRRREGSKGAAGEPGEPGEKRLSEGGVGGGEEGEGGGGGEVVKVPYLLRGLRKRRE